MPDLRDDQARAEYDERVVEALAKLLVAHHRRVTAPTSEDRSVKEQPRDAA
jgi:hypothetical protein